MRMKLQKLLEYQGEAKKIGKARKTIGKARKENHRKQIGQP